MRDFKRGQVTIFIILALVIVAGIVIYYSLQGSFVNGVSKNVKPVEDYYVDCMKTVAQNGVSLIGEQGGHLELPDFDPGSDYMPFSSQLNFLGQAVPYWFYVSGNNIIREQVPTKQSMQDELSNFVMEREDFCDFSSFEAQGYNISVKPGAVSVTISDKQVQFNIKSSVSVVFENESAILNQHDFSLSSKLGKFFNTALEFYNYQKANSVLESYALDVMRLYAPVTGVEFGCSPKVFIKETIKTNIMSALEANIASIKLAGSYYNLNSPENSYFVINLPKKVDESVNLLYSSSFPTRIEITGDEVVNPVGLQQGLGILGFCYVPYQFVYDINFPVLTQFYDAETSEIFQFPVAVVIKGNQPRSSFVSGTGQSLESDVCQYKPQKVTVKTSNSKGESVKATVRFKCFDSVCQIGTTKLYENGAFLEGMFPQCVNGVIIASAQNYSDSKYFISTNEEIYADITLDRLYEVPIVTNLPGKSAMISFDGEDYSTTVMLPDFSSVKLKQGMYNVSMYVFQNSTMKLPATSERKCFNLPKSGLLGKFGLEEEKCFNVEIPAQELGSVVVGGGNNVMFFSEDMLDNAKQLKITSELFDIPSKLEDVQANYLKVEDNVIDVEVTN